MAEETTVQQTAETQAAQSEGTPSEGAQSTSTQNEGAQSATAAELEAAPKAAEPEAKTERKADPKASEPEEIRKILTAAGVAENVSAEDGVKKLAEDNARLSAAVEAVKLGANADTASDLVSIALGKVTESKDVKAVISELKGQAAYSGFFTKSAPSGTGGGVSGKAAHSTAAGSMGARLAQSARKTVDSPYFKH